MQDGSSAYRLTEKYRITEREHKIMIVNISAFMWVFPISPNNSYSYRKKNPVRMPTLWCHLQKQQRGDLEIWDSLAFSQKLL